MRVGRRSAPASKAVGADPLEAYATEADRLEEWIRLRFGGAIREHLPAVLLQPLRDLMGRRGKRIRGRLVRIGYDLAFPARLTLDAQPAVCARLADAIEFLHAGSLAVDDIQDGSKTRRGEPSLHLKFGFPLALNTGNWMYFWPLEMIRQLRLPAERELKIHRIYHRTLIRAHIGQALDVGVPVTQVAQEKVPGLCLSAMELKSGALFALALLVGAVAGGADDDLVDAFDEFGHGFGIALQMFDDLGNVKGRVEPTKKWEDLMLRRPTFVWATAASRYPQASYQSFVAAVRQLPQDRRLVRWMENHRFEEAMAAEANAHLDRCLSKAAAALGDRVCAVRILEELRTMGREIAHAYG